MDGRPGGGRGGVGSVRVLLREAGLPLLKERQGRGPKLPSAAGQHVVTGDEVEGVGVLDGVGDVGPRGPLEASSGVGDALAELSEAHLGDRGQ